VRGRVGAKALAPVRETCAPKGASRPWNHGRGTRADGLKCLEGYGAFDLVFLRVRGCRAPWTTGRSEHRKASRRKAHAERCHGLAARKGFEGENPRSGSGPSVSAGPEGEQTVEGAKNPEDGWCRVRQTRVIRIPLPMSLKG